MTWMPCVALLLLTPSVCVADDRELGPIGKRAAEMVENRNYRVALRYLEDALAETPDHPRLFELQGLAYLGCGGAIDSIQCLEKAEEAMHKAIEHGGRASVVVDRSLERGGLFSNPNIIKVKRGWLRVTSAEVIFEPAQPDATNAVITIPASDLKEAALNTNNGKSTNAFHISSKKDTYNFRTANFSADEAQLIFRLLETHLGFFSKKK